MTINAKLSLLHWSDPWEASLPLSPGALGQDDKQQLLWGYPDILWSSAAVVLVTSTDLTTLLEPHLVFLAITEHLHDWDLAFAADIPTVRNTQTDSWDDLNTAYWEYLQTHQ
jgi:hypothetical protein